MGVWFLFSCNCGYAARVSGMPDMGFIAESATMEFKMSILPYSVRLEWIEPTLFAIQETLYSKTMPRHNEYCEYGKFLEDFHNATGVL